MFCNEHTEKDTQDSIVLIERFGAQQTSEACFGGERNLSINCYDLRYLRRYLLLVGQWYPEEWNSTKRAFYHVWQVCVIFGVWTYFIYSLGCFGDSTLNHQYFKWFPLNAIEGVIWESRWVISHHLGLYYFCVSRHMENFLQDSCLNQSLWNETSRYLKRICMAVIVLIFVIPVILRPFELDFSLSSEGAWLIVMDTVYLAVDRLVTAPVFLVFVFEAYVLVRVVKGYGESIKIWPKDFMNTPGSGMRSAKQQFIKINSLICSVGSNFQLYLALHFLLLLITAFLGVFACAEQIETKINQNRTYYRADTPSYYKRIKIAPSIIKPLVIKLVPTNSSEPYEKKLFSEKAGTKSLTPNGILLNVTLTKEDTETIPEPEASRKQILIEVGIEAVLRILESIVMYMIPLTLMLRLQTKLSIVQRTILYSDCFDQQENGYLFQDDESIKIMAEFIETCKGITVFGYKMPLFRAFLLSVLAPFLTALTTFLFSYIHVKRR